MNDTIRARRGCFLTAAIAALAGGLFLANPLPVSANHPVLVEGEKDFDGDGLTGAAEDADNATDRIFGTLTAALASANGGANQNGRITIVTSGRFPEALAITGANGNVTIEAAPGVEANIDAVLAGNAGTVERQGFPGISINAPATRIITLRNLVVRNWTTGISVGGASRVIVDNCRIEHNVSYGVHAFENAKLTLVHSAVTGSGFRVGGAPMNDADPGVGVEFNDMATGVVTDTLISGSAKAGISNNSRQMNAVVTGRLVLSDNNPDQAGRLRNAF